MDARRKEMGEGTLSRPPSAKATQWLAMMQHSESTIVGWMSKQKSVSSRYRVRAWAEVLTTYSNEVRRSTVTGIRLTYMGTCWGKGSVFVVQGNILKLWST